MCGEPMLLLGLAPVIPNIPSPTQTPSHKQYQQAQGDHSLGKVREFQSGQGE